MKSARLYPVVMICGALAACGGSSGSTPAPGTLSISPATASVAAGGTQLFTANGGSGGSVTWQVNGTVGGNAGVGTISTSGLYTAPPVPPVSQPVSITAIQGSTTASAAATVTYSNASLSGQYVFTFEEIDIPSGTETNAVGLIAADGKGNVSGTEDVNSPAQVFNAVPVTGSYTLSANGQGSLTIDGGSAGTLTLTFTLVAGAAEGVLTDAATGKLGGGDLFPMTASVNTVSDLNGSYTLALGSAAVASNDNSVGLLSLPANGSIDTTGSYLDENNGGAYTSSGPGSVSGSYSVGSFNRGTLSLTVGASTSHYVFYAVSPGQLEIMCADNGCTNAGSLDLQTTQAVTTGNYVFSLVGSGTGQAPDALLVAGNMTSTSTTGGTASFTLYENNNGVYQSKTGSTTYTLSSLGRGLVVLPTAIMNRSFVFYVQSAGNLNLLESSSGFGNTSGFGVAAQSNAAAVSGRYLLLTVGEVPNSQSVSTSQAVLQVTTAGQVMGQAVLDADGNISTVSVSGTLAVSKTPGTYTLVLNLSGGQTETYVLAASSPGVLSVVGSDSDVVRTGAMIIQYTAP